MKIDLGTTVQITYFPEMIVVSKDYLYRGSGKIDRAKLMIENRKTTYNGYMSDSTSRKVKKILTTWANAIRFNNDISELSVEYGNRKLIFVTLTLSSDQLHDDLFIKRNMLNRFILKMQKDFDVKYYFWKSEKQANGRIHFHLIFDRFVDMKIIQSEWNLIQSDYGYLDEFKRKFNRCNPPSTHVEIVRENSDLDAYITKYMSKKESEKIISNNVVRGRIWGCSDELRNLKPYQSGEESSVLSQLNQAVIENKVEKIEDEFFCLYKIHSESFLKTRCISVYKDYVNYYLSVYDNLYNKQELCRSVLTPLNESVAVSVFKEPNSIQLKLFDIKPSYKIDYD